MAARLASFWPTSATRRTRRGWPRSNRQALDTFLCAVGPRQSRASLQHVVGHLRAFLRFLASAGEIPTGLDTQIDTPRVYRGEQLPRALPWDTVRALLQSIDRSSPLGRRDYAIFLLMATYGLRACEVVTLTIDDVEWRAGRLRIPQRKTRGSLWLPLTDEVGTALLDYLRHGRPALNVRRQRVPFRGGPPRSYRELFLRCRTPTGVLKPTAVTEAFQAWSKRSGLAIPFQGAHCVRHSYAVHLLRSGLSLKTIGDLLGHRTLESTCVYLRLAVDDLRDVALPLPAAVESQCAGGGVMTTFSSVLSATIGSHLTLKRALGRQYAAEEWVLAHLDRFLAARRVDLIAETFAAWCLTLQHLASGTRRGRMRVVRNLCLYRRRSEPACFVPDERLFPPVRQAIRPHIFTDNEIVQLLAAARTLPRTSNSPFCPETMRLAIVVLSTTGLRRGELTRLTVGDYDLPQRTLAIRESKFHKSRLVPVSADTAREIEHLIAVRGRWRLPAGADSPLLWHRHPPTGGYSGGGLGGAMRALFRRAGVRTANGHLPRTHDFRHGFAVNALLRWYRAGLDVQSKLPFLAAYMGHVSIVSTAYYLQFVEPLAVAASARFADRCGALITGPTGAGGAR